MVSCCVKGCNSRSPGPEAVMMHTFPRDVEVFNAWCANVGRHEITISKRYNYRVCDKHFSEEMKYPILNGKYKTNLKVGAVPTLNLNVPHDEVPVLSQILKPKIDYSSSSGILSEKIKFKRDKNTLVKLKGPGFSLTAKKVDSSILQNKSMVIIGTVSANDIVSVDGPKNDCGVSVPDDIKKQKVLIKGETDLSDICRICMNNSKNMTHLKTLFEKNEMHSLLIYFDVDVMDDERAPNQLCSDCMSRLESVIEFRNMCMKSDNTISQTLNLKEPVFNDIIEDATILTDTSNSVDWHTTRTTPPTYEYMDVKCENIEDNLVPQIVITTPKREEALLCFICGKMGNNLPNMRRHLQNHQKPDTRLTCRDCKLRFRRRANLERHICLPLKKYQCLVCYNVYYTKQNLDMHILAHSNIKMYGCNCGSKFAQYSSLVAHKRTVHQEVILNRRHRVKRLYEAV